MRLDTGTPPLICVHSPGHVGPPAADLRQQSLSNQDAAIEGRAVQDRHTLTSSPSESSDPLAGAGEVVGGGGGSAQCANLLSSTPASNNCRNCQGRSGAHRSPDALGEWSEGGSLDSMSSLPEGTFSGQAKHKDGSLLQIVFQVGGCGNAAWC